MLLDHLCVVPLMERQLYHTQRICSGCKTLTTSLRVESMPFSTHSVPNCDKDLNNELKSTQKALLIQRVLKRPSSPATAVSGLTAGCTDCDTQKDIKTIGRQSVHDLVSFLRQGGIKENRLVIWKALSLRAQQLIPVLSGEDAVRILYAFSIRRLRDEALIQPLLQRLMPLLHTLGAPELSRCLSALARLNVRADVFFRSASRHVAIRAAGMSPRELSEIAFAYGRLRYFHLPLHNVLRVQVVQQLQSFQPRDLTLLLHSLKALKLNDSPLFCSVVSQVNRILPQFTGDELVVVLNTYAAFQITHSLSLQMLSEMLYQKRNDLVPFSLGLALHSMSRLMDHDWGFLATNLVEKATTEGKYYRLDSISLVLYGTSRLLPRCPALEPRVTALFKMLGRRMGELALHLTPSVVTTAAYAYAKANVRYGPVFYHTPIHIARYAEDYTPDQLGLVVKAFTRMNIYHPGLFESVISQLPRFCVPPHTYPLRQHTESWMAMRQRRRIGTSQALSSSDGEKAGERPDAVNPFVRVQALLRVLEGMAHFHFCDDQVLSQLAEQLTLRSKELNIEESISCIMGFLALNRRDTVLFAAVVDHVVEAWNACHNEPIATTSSTRSNHARLSASKATFPGSALDIGTEKSLSSVCAMPLKRRQRRKRPMTPLTGKQAAQLYLALKKANMPIEQHLPLSLIRFSRRYRRMKRPEQPLPPRSTVPHTKPRIQRQHPFGPAIPYVLSDNAKEEELFRHDVSVSAGEKGLRGCDSDGGYAVHWTRNVPAPPKHIDKVNWSDWNFKLDDVPMS